MRETLFKDLPKFKTQIPIHFSEKEFYLRKQTDQDSFTSLEEIFQKLDRNQII